MAQTFTYNGKEWRFPLTALQLSGDLDQDAGTVAGNIGLLANLLGEHETQLSAADADYRNWRAKTYLEKKVGAKPPSDEAVKAMVEADVGFLQHKRIIADLEGKLATLKGYVDAMRYKGEMVKVLANRQRNVAQGERAGYDGREDSPGGKPALVPADRAEARKVIEQTKQRNEEQSRRGD